MKLTSSKPQPKKISPLDQPNDQQNPEYTSSLNTKDGSDNKGRNKKICSPSSSPPPSTPNRRGRGRQQADNIKEFDRGTKGSSTRQLWSPSSSLPRSSQFKAQPPGNRSRLISRAKIAQHEMEEPDPEPGPEAEEDDSHTKDPSVSQLIRQPETRPISQEQLVAEVKAIYAGLPQVESKLIEVDNSQSANKTSSGFSGYLRKLHPTIRNKHKDAQEFSSREEEFDNTQHPKAKEKESKQSGLLATTEEFDNTQHPKAKEKESKLSRVLAAIVSWINSLITPTKSKCTKDFSSGEEEYFVAGSVNGTVVEALPDTGAEGCFISRDMASRFGFHPTPGQKKRITLANKKTIKSRGMVTVPWKFSEQQITHSINCWILPKCIRGLVLGYDFLKRTNCLGQVCSRSKAKILGESRRRLLSYLGNGNQRLQGELNGHSTAALPDTGSDAMFINGAYARRLGLDVDSDLKNQVQVRLADGSIIMTSGIVRDVEWRVGSTTVRCNFHVLEDLCVNVILSNSYLFGMKIYSEQEEHFFDINSESNSQDDHEDAKLEELWRRDEARDKKAMLPKDQREAETKAEEARQQLWEAQKSEREAKWKAVYTVTGNVQHSVSRRNQWKERISISFLDELVERLTSTRSP
ncbi:hypothetical protein J3E69DRAFT_360427 [Trichoderma sp. SZMC 28015]